jgi:hypothetical protein
MGRLNVAGSEMGIVTPKSPELPLSPWLTQPDLGPPPPSLLSAALSAMPPTISTHTPPEPFTVTLPSSSATPPAVYPDAPPEPTAGTAPTSVSGGFDMARFDSATFDGPPSPSPPESQPPLGPGGYGTSALYGATSYNASAYKASAAPVPETVALEARSETRVAGSGGLSADATINKPKDPRRRTRASESALEPDAFQREAEEAELNPDPAVEREIFESAFREEADEGKSVKRKAKGGRSARTKVGRAVLKNAGDIALIGASFIALIDSRLEKLREERPNSDEAKAAVKREIEDCEDLKQRVEAFLGAASEFSTKEIEERSVINATTSVAEGIGRWWSKNHPRICDQAFQMGLFGVGVVMCSLAGAGGPLSALIPGAMVGGKSVAAAVKAWRKAGE